MVCWGCGLIFPIEDAAYVEDDEDGAIECPDCGSSDLGSDGDDH